MSQFGPGVGSFILWRFEGNGAGVLGEVMGGIGLLCNFLKLHGEILNFLEILMAFVFHEGQVRGGTLSVIEGVQT